jgi:hypothetical protein
MDREHVRVRRSLFHREQLVIITARVSGNPASNVGGSRQLTNLRPHEFQLSRR